MRLLPSRMILTSCTSSGNATSFGSLTAWDLFDLNKVVSTIAFLRCISHRYIQICRKSSRLARLPPFFSEDVETLRKRSERSHAQLSSPHFKRTGVTPTFVVLDRMGHAHKLLRKKFPEGGMSHGDRCSSRMCGRGVGFCVQLSAGPRRGQSRSEALQGHYRKRASAGTPHPLRAARNQRPPLASQFSRDVSH